MWNQGSNAGNQGGNLIIAVQITWNRNGNDKLKDWREASFFDAFDPVPFLLTLGIFSTMSVCFYY